MLSLCSGVQFMQGVAALGDESKRTRTAREKGQGDSVTISEAAYAALEASRGQGASGAASAASGSQNAQVVLDDSLPDAAADKGTSKKAGLMDELREYIANPILKHALDQMDEAIDKMGLDPAAAEAVREEVMAVFRSGIPAEGEQTSDAMSTLRKNLKKNTGLGEEQIGGLMENMATIVEDAQKKEERLGKDDKDGQRDVSTVRS